MRPPPPSDAGHALTELTAALDRDCRSLVALGWPGELLLRCTSALERLTDDAQDLGQAAIRDAGMDLFAYLVGVEEASAPRPQQAQTLLGLVDALADAVARGLPAAHRPVRYIDLVCERGDFPPALAQALGEAGFALRSFSHWGELADAVLRTPGAALLVEADQLAPSGAVLESLSNQLPAAGATVIFGFGGGHDRSRLDALLHGAAGHVDSLHDPQLAARLLELVDAPPEEAFRVLVVDDDLQSSRYLRLVLEQGGMQVRECADPRQVPALVSDHPPDLLLLDLHMPEVDGLTLTMALRRQPALALMPILFISGEERENVRFQAIQAGADDFLCKPVRPRVLLAEVSSRIKRARLARRQLQLPADEGAKPAPRRGGLMRRGDFLAQMAAVQRQPGGDCHVLMSVKVDQAQELGKRLGQSGAYELEQGLAARFAELLDDHDACTIWLEFGFGVLVQRPGCDEVATLAQELCRRVRARPFLVRGMALDLTVSVGVALPPTGAGSGDPDRWFAAAYAGMSIAHRMGGDRHDGVLGTGHGDMPAERVLIIREFVKNAARGEHIVVDYQPMLPLRGANVAGHYAQATKLRDFRAPLAGIRRDEYLEAAREARALAMIDRTSVFTAFESIQEQRDHRHDSRVLVPMDLLSFDSAQLGWLMAELRRRKALVDGLLIEFDAAPLLANPALASVLRQLRDSGITLSLSEPSGSLALIERLHDVPVHLLRLPHAAIEGVTPQAFAALAAPWRQGGRGLIVDHVRSIDAVSRLWDLGIDFLQGDALAASGPRLDYDFQQDGR
jgi:PleD family two-component response regulator/EAL domain-containing protein (putative c-di-GMP-specific phosphodiesterase class I)